MPDNIPLIKKVDFHDETLNTIHQVVRKTDSKIVYFIIDGLGDLPIEGDSEKRTILQKENFKNLNWLAENGSCGTSIACWPPMPVGSGEGHLSLFGYNPINFPIGRGVIESLGADADIETNDIGIRINLATQNKDGIVVDRRAGRIPTEKTNKLVELLNKKIRIDIPEMKNVKLVIQTSLEHRIAVVLKGGDLGGDVQDTDPGKNGMPLNEIAVLYKPGEDYSSSMRTAKILRELSRQITEILRSKEARDIVGDNNNANVPLFRGIGKYHYMPKMKEVFKLDACAICPTPAYKGVAKAIGMDVLPVGPNLEDQLDVYRKNFNKYTFLFVHFKLTDKYGENGDIENKTKAFKMADSIVREFLNPEPDIFFVGGDHSTPASIVKGHSGDPVPFIFYSPKGRVRKDNVRRFDEISCSCGAMGTNLPAYAIIMPSALEFSGKLRKFEN